MHLIQQPNKKNFYLPNISHGAISAQIMMQQAKQRWVRLLPAVVS
jgi:hypothetical protein